MIAAIYARKSTEQNGVADEMKSVIRQVEHAKAYAMRRGWTVVDDFIFVDDGISGAEFAARPGYVRLLNMLKPRAPFDVLIMSEESRLGREQIEVSYALKQIVSAKVRVFCYMTDTERTLDSPIEKTMLALQARADEMERERARQRTLDGMHRVAKAGRVTGGACFGYRNIRILNASGQPSHTERAINEAEAGVIRRIFEMCAAGKGVKSIAKLLNAEGAPSPRPQRGCPKGWAASSVRSVLFRRTYLGEIVYGQTKKRDRWGQRKCERRPESEWLRVPQPAWRIVTDEAWKAAHARLTATAKTYLRNNGGQVWGRPATGLEAKYLLSGIGRCGLCGASMIGHRTTRDRFKSYRYVCSGYNHRGPSVCPNNTGLPMLGADATILEELRDHVLDPEIVEGAIQDAIAELRPSSDAAEAMRATIQRELRETEQAQMRLIDAIATAGDVAALAAALKDRELRRAQLTGELTAIDQHRRTSHRFDPLRVERDLRRRLTEYRRLLGQQPPIARQIVVKLLEDGRVIFTPKPDEGYYEFSARTVLDRLLCGVIPPEMALPQVWRALQDSNLRPPGS